MKEKYRYTYRLTRLSDGAFYTGSRSAATCPPEEDFGTHYFTSGVLEKEFRANPEQFTWVIHSEDYADDVAMLEDEQRLIQESWDEPGRMNRSAWPIVFEMDEEWREKMHDLYQSPEWLKKTTEGAKRRSLNPEWRKKNAEGAKRRALDPEWRKKNAENPYNFSRMAQDPEWLEKNAERCRQMAQDPEWRKKNAESAKRRALDPVWQEKNAAKNRKKWKDPEWRKMMSEALTKGRARKWQQDPEYRKMMLKTLAKARAQSLLVRQERAAARLNGTETEVDRMARKKRSEAARNPTALTRKKMSEAAKKRGARERAARLANEDALPFDQSGVPVKKNRG